MPKAPTRPPGGEPHQTEDTPNRPPDGLIRTGVLGALGRPPGLYEVAVRALWENHYRVNVLIGTDPTALRIAHSYFVEAQENGDILSATPRITRLYT